MTKNERDNHESYYAYQADLKKQRQAEVEAKMAKRKAQAAK